MRPRTTAATPRATSSRARSPSSTSAARTRLPRRQRPRPHRRRHPSSTPPPPEGASRSCSTGALRRRRGRRRRGASYRFHRPQPPGLPRRGGRTTSNTSSSAAAGQPQRYPRHPRPREQSVRPSSVKGRQENADIPARHTVRGTQGQARLFPRATEPARVPDKTAKTAGRLRTQDTQSVGAEQDSLPGRRL